MTDVVEEEPYAAVVHDEFLSSVCSYCFDKSFEEKALSRCAKCKIVHYCSADCQKKDWRIHKTECSFFVEKSPFIPSEDT
ncbi:hypothetical protein PFISCL1PPCAC_24340 [Pristionchus fissidentatus]|uniref:MYND-type domain-containing protein n=1 Tax=Pristionchus fissidentatus TaxID=1538716 RepID=A0AAV5WS16_9BILA|nr:hypothetical protein PFISCL1PPCAC_24340 [Pristionchus fissidentatus]